MLSAGKTGVHNANNAYMHTHTGRLNNQIDIGCNLTLVCDAVQQARINIEIVLMIRVIRIERAESVEQH